jgi:CBS domain-containing protein
MIPRKEHAVGQIADILRHKGTEVCEIAPDETVYAAVVRMVDANVGSLLVRNGDEIVGIISERDYLRRVALEERSAREIAVREIMSAPVVTVSSDASIEDCMTVMTERRVRHMPVVDGGVLVGIVSIGDLVKARSAEQSTHIQVLHEYITAR